MISVLILIPLITALLVGMQNAVRARSIAVIGSIAALYLSGYMIYAYAGHDNFRESCDKFYLFGLEYRVATATSRTGAKSAT